MSCGDSGCIDWWWVGSWVGGWVGLCQITENGINLKLRDKQII